MAKKPFQRSQLGAPYDDMVVRVYEHVLQLMQEAVAGRRLAVASRAARLAGQAKALAELLDMERTEPETEPETKN